MDNTITAYFNDHSIRWISGGGIVDCVKATGYKAKIKSAQFGHHKLEDLMNSPGQYNQVPQPAQGLPQQQQYPVPGRSPGMAGGPFVPSPQPFGPDDPSDAWAYGRQLPSARYYTRGWRQKQIYDAQQQAYAARQALLSQQRAEQSPQGGGMQGLDGIFGLLGQMGIDPAMIPGLIQNLFSWFQGSSGGSNQGTQNGQEEGGNKTASLQSVKAGSSPIMGTILETAVPAIVGGLGGGSIGAIYGYIKYLREKKKGKTVPSSPTADMAYGFAAGAMLGSGSALIYSSLKDMNQQLF